MISDNSVKVFFELVKAGLWGENVILSSYSKINWGEIYRLAIDQTVLGLVLAGLEHVDEKPPQVMLLQWIGEVQVMEQQNKAMNTFIAELVNDLREADIYTLLVKGQGIAQCYERPLWRVSGDVDFYLSDSNFIKAKTFFRPLITKIEPDNETTQHINMHYGDWVVEIHGNQHCLSSSANKVLDEIHQDLFYGGNVRSWNNNGTSVFLPSPDNDVLIIFTHFFNHFYKGGLGIRQICDWCRLLWNYRNELDVQLLEKRLKKMGLMSMWKAFASFAVDFLGMPEEAMPFYTCDKKWSKKAGQICTFIIDVGNFGHNRDFSYYGNNSKLLRKVTSFGIRCRDILHHARIFPLDSLRFFPQMVYNGLKAVAQGG